MTNETGAINSIANPSRQPRGLAVQRTFDGSYVSTNGQGVFNHVSSTYCISTMIAKFRCKDTEALFRTGRVAPWLKPIERTARRKLDLLDYANSLGDLRAPPGNRLEMLKGTRFGQHSIRINDKWRICFAWSSEGPTEVEIVDYH